MPLFSRKPKKNAYLFCVESRSIWGSLADSTEFRKRRMNKCLGALGGKGARRVVLHDRWRQLFFEKSRFPTENPGNPRKNSDVGSRGSGAVIFIVNCFERFAGKLHIIMLLHLKLITFRIAYVRDRNLTFPGFRDF